MNTEVCLTIGQQFAKALQSIPERSLEQLATELDTTVVTLRKWSTGNLPYALVLITKLHDDYKFDLNKIFTQGEQDAIRSSD